MTVPSTLGGPLGVHDGSADGVLSACAVSSSTSQQSFNQSLPQVPLIGQQQISQVQRPLQSPQELPSYMLTQTPLQQHGQLQIPQSAGQTPFSHALLGLGGQLFVSQPQVQQNASSVQQAAMNSNLHPHHPSAAANEQQLPLQQSASQFAQMLSQQKQTLQASFQSSQQAFSQLQQQFQLIQPSNQNLMSHQFSQATKQQMALLRGLVDNPYWCMEKNFHFCVELIQYFCRPQILCSSLLLLSWYIYHLLLWYTLR